MRFSLLFSVLSLLCSQTFAVKIHGRITDENAQPLPYVIVYITGTSIGTTANSEGIYSLELQSGEYEVNFRMIGYKLDTRKVIAANTDIVVNVQMTSETVSLKEVTIRADSEDPAYAIIRAAQEKRKFYRDQVQLYGCTAYVKSTQRLDKYPKRLMGQDVNVGDMDSVTKIFYLSESVSELFYKAPDKYKEKMISSKVSGSPQTYSFNQATDVLISLYDNLIELSELTPRGLISPIAGNALMYYKYRLEGTFMQNGVLVNKISVIPKRRFDPVFTGTIYIMEDTWRIHSSDLTITKDQQMEVLDTFHIIQNYIKVSEEVWMPFTQQYDYTFDILGFKGNGIVLGIFSDYSLKPRVNYRFFDAEIMMIDSSANKKDSSYWVETRPVPLTEIESEDYRRKDSLRLIRESKPYLDSVDQENNRIKLADLLTGFTWRNSFKNKSVSVRMPLRKTFFNTVEGWNTGISAEYIKERGGEDDRYYSIMPSVRYGFSNTHWNGHIRFRTFYNGITHGLFEADAGTDLVQFNAKNPIGELINTAYSILAEKNYMKVYEKRFFNVSHRSEIVNGINLQFKAEYAKRNSLSNTSNYKVIEVKKRVYTSNDPYHSHTDSLRFSSHNAFIASLGVTFRPGQKYINRPEGRYFIPSKWPGISIHYTRGLNIASSDIDYDMIQASISDEMQTGLVGEFRYLVVGGDYLTVNKIFGPDLKHFSGNKTWFSDFNISDFKNLDYYKYSTAGPYFEVHAEQNFGGFFLNKIPFIRKLKLQEIAGVHFLHTEAVDRYIDISAGIEKLGIFRVELFTSVIEGQKGSVGFLIGIKQLLN